MVIASYVDASKNYNVVLNQDGQSVSCQCKDHLYRNRECKHMTVATRIAQEEIEKASTFLSLKAQYDFRAPAVKEARRAAFVNLYNPCSID